jgi:hypothetical protein
MRMKLTEQEQRLYDHWNDLSLHTNSYQILQERHNMWINTILNNRTKTK